MKTILTVKEICDRNFHVNVIPKWECEKCGKTSGESYRPLSTQYPEGYQI